VTKDGGRSTEVDVFIADADVVLAVGTMFKQEDTANWGLKPGKKLIHIDVDDQEIGRSYEADLGIVADARAAIEAILQEMPAREQAAPSWMARGTEAQAAALAQRRAESPQEMTVLDAFRSAVPRDAIVLCDRCNLGYWAWRCMPAYEPRSFVYPMGYGGLGGAMPQAIGAKLADPARPVVCVIGDGGFQFTGPELIVAVQDEVPITIVLCNNNSYGAIAAAMTNSFGAAPLGCKLQNPDFQKLAAAYGVPHVRADNAKSLGEKVAAGIASNALNIIEMTIDVSDPPG
jgi:acetolactate synthase-1/2/3 large subunit